MELNRRDLLKPPGASFVTTAALSFLPAVTSMVTPDTDSDGVVCQLSIFRNMALRKKA